MSCDNDLFTDRIYAEHEAYYNKHVQVFGYPPGWSLEIGRGAINRSLARMHELVKLNAPAVIIQNEENILTKRIMYAVSWMRDNPSTASLG